VQDNVVKRRLYEEQIVKQIVVTAVEKAISMKITKDNIEKFLDENMSAIIDESVK
jgi:hypothetical protein